MISDMNMHKRWASCENSSELPIKAQYLEDPSGGWEDGWRQVMNGRVVIRFFEHHRMAIYGSLLLPLFHT